MTATEVDSLAGARVAWLIELLHQQNIEHLDDCTEQAECGACVIEDVNTALTEPSRRIGGRRFPSEAKADSRPVFAVVKGPNVSGFGDVHRIESAAKVVNLYGVLHIYGDKGIAIYPEGQWWRVTIKEGKE